MAKYDEIERMDEEKLVHYLRRYTQNARDFQDEKLMQKWKEAQKFYYGEKLGNEVKGRSQVISRDVSDAVDWMMPSLMKIFASDGEAVMYEPRNQGSIAAAQSMTDYANYVFFVQNNGFEVMHTWFKDALLFNLGILKHYWTEEEYLTTESYSGISDAEVTAILNRDGCELLAMTSDESENTFDIEVSMSTMERFIKIEPVPPEEFIIDRQAKSLEDFTFMAHQRRVTFAELLAMGLSEEEATELNENDEDDASDSELRLVREMYNGAQTHDYDKLGLDKGNDKYWLVEAYVHIDFDGDGHNELRRVVFCGNKILSNEDWDYVPFSSITPNPIQHQLYGQSLYDMVHDVQEVKTALVRNQLDNMYLINNGRFAAVEGQVNLTDLKNNVLGGVVREKMTGAIRRLDTPELPKGVFEMMGYYDEVKTNRTGVSQRTQGLDDKVLNSHTGTGQVNRVMSVAEQRLELVARIFANTGVRNLFRCIKQLGMKYQDKELQFKLHGKFITINPAEWRENIDMRVIVGMGTKDKDQQLGHLMRLYELTLSIINNGGMGILTSEEKIFNLVKEITDNAGYKDPDKFFLDPTSPEAMQAKEARAKKAAEPTPEMIEADSKAAVTRSDIQMAQVEAQHKTKELDVESQVKLKELEIKEREMALEERKQALQEDIQDMEREKFEWSKQVNISEVILERESQKAVAIGDGKLFKGRNKGKTDSGNTGQ